MGAHSATYANSQDRALSLVAQAGRLESFHLDVEGVTFLSDSISILQALQIKQLRSLALPLRGEPASVAVIGSFGSLVQLSVTLVDRVRFGELNPDAVWTFTQLRISEWRNPTLTVFDQVHATTYHTSFLSRCRFPQLHRVSIEDNLLGNCTDTIRHYDAFFRAHSTILAITLTVRAIPLLASIRTRRLGFLNAANDPFSRATREWLLGIQPDVQDIVLHAFPMTTSTLWRFEMNLDALHQALDRLPSVEIRRIVLGQVNDRTDEVFRWDGGRRTLWDRGVMTWTMTFIR
jgi:hypothetical protein